jgi:hypothetical protein
MDYFRNFESKFRVFLKFFEWNWGVFEILSGIGVFLKFLGGNLMRS